MMLIYLVLSILLIYFGVYGQYSFILVLAKMPYDMWP